MASGDGLLAVALRWARHAAWILLGAGFLILVASSVWGRAWGPVAMALIAAGYCLGVIAVLPIVGHTLGAAVAAVAGLARRAWPRRFTASK